MSNTGVVREVSHPNIPPFRRNAKGKVWGSDEVNFEGWKPLKRLPGHESGESLSSTLRKLAN